MEKSTLPVSTHTPTYISQYAYSNLYIATSIYKPIYRNMDNTTYISESIYSNIHIQTHILQPLYNNLYTIIYMIEPIYCNIDNRVSISYIFKGEMVTQYKPLFKHNLKPVSTKTFIIGGLLLLKMESLTELKNILNRLIFHLSICAKLKHWYLTTFIKVRHHVNLGSTEPIKKLLLYIVSQCGNVVSSYIKIVYNNNHSIYINPSTFLSYDKKQTLRKGKANFHSLKALYPTEVD